MAFLCVSGDGNKVEEALTKLPFPKSSVKALMVETVRKVSTTLRTYRRIWK